MGLKVTADPLREMDRKPAWTWFAAIALCLVVLGGAASTSYLIAWEGDRGEFEEHRSLFFARSLSYVTAEFGDYYAQRFIESLRSEDETVQEAFVIADGGTDDFGISRGQTYSASADKDLRHKILSSLSDEPRHRIRADRFSRSTAGLDAKVRPGRVHPAFVLESDEVDGRLVYATQVPLLTTGEVVRTDSAGVSVGATFPPAPIPWSTLLLMVIGFLGVAGAAFAIPALRSGVSRSLAGSVILVIAATTFTTVFVLDYDERHEEQLSSRVADVETVQKAAEYAQVRGEQQTALVRYADVTFTGDLGYLFGAMPGSELLAEDQLLIAATEKHGGGRQTLIWASMLVLLISCLLVHRFLVQVADSCRTQPSAYAYVLPSVLGMLILVFVPFGFGIGLSVFDNDARRYYYVGAANFIEILSGTKTSDVSFYWTLFVTVLWTTTNVVLHLGIGLGLALILKDPLLRFKRVYRVLLIIPWAIPNYITALIWKAMFNKEFGAVNGAIAAVQSGFGWEVTSIDWLGGSFITAFTANLVTNTWLGFPFMMVVSLGALQSIPGALYEAASVDGASPWQQFKTITVPLLKPALFPAIILGTIWTFNMFNVIYLVSGGHYQGH